MAGEERTILLKVELDVAQLQRNATEAESKLKTLIPAMDKIAKEQGKNTIEYKKAQAEVRNYNKILTDSVKALELNAKLSASNSGSIVEMREQLSAATISYNNLTKEQRENSDVGTQLRNDIKSISDALKEQEGAIGDNRRNVGNYAGAIAELKAELKAYKGEMLGLSADSERYQELSIKAGEVADKIKEVNENTKAQTGGTGFEKLSNNLGLIKGDLENLDFEGVSEKMGQMAKISQAMTFKEAIGGLKNMGSSLLSLAKAILSNPLFIVAGAITAIVVALKVWNDTVNEDAVRAQKAHADSIDRTTKFMEAQMDRANRMSDLNIRLAELEGKSTKELGALRLKQLDEQNDAEQALYNKKFDLIDSLTKMRNKAASDEERDQIQSRIDQARDEQDQLWESTLSYYKRREVLQKEVNVQILEEEKAAAEKRKNAAKKAHEDRIALERRMSDLYMDGVELSNDNEEKRIQAKYDFLLDLAGENTDEILRLEGEKNAELTALDVKFKEEEIARVTEQYRREIEDAKGNSKVIAQLKKNEALEKEQIDIEYKAKEQERSSTHQKNLEAIEKQRSEQARKNAAEIALIDAELNLLKVKGTKDEFAAWQAVQNAKILQLETLSTLELENENLTASERIRIAKETELSISQIKAESYEAEKKKADEQQKLDNEQKKSLALSAINSAQQLSDTLFQIANNQIQREINALTEQYEQETEMLQNQLDNGLITQAEFNAQKSAIDSEFNAKEKKLKEEQFKKQKAAQLINATIAAAVGVTNAMAAPPPVGFIMAGIAAALGAAQIAVIASQPTPTFERGGEPLKSGIFGGRPHSRGGTKGVFDDGTQIEVEKDEAFFVINKRSTNMISALSNLNQRGGGVPLMERGGALRFATGGVFASSISAPVESHLDFQRLIVETIEAMPNPVVFVEDINTGQNRTAGVQDRATFQ